MKIAIFACNNRNILFNVKYGFCNSITFFKVMTQNSISSDQFYKKYVMLFCHWMRYTANLNSNLGALTFNNRYVLFFRSFN